MAAGLAKARYGEALVHEISSCYGETNDFLAAWRHGLREELHTNSSGFLPSRQPALAQSLASDFPNLKVAEHYISPMAEEPICFIGHGPDPIRLAAFAEEHFHWGSTDAILVRFTTTIFQALPLAHLYSVARETGLGLARRPCKYISEVLQCCVMGHSSNPRHPEVHMSCVLDDALVDAIIKAVQGTQNDSETERKVKYWRTSLLPRLRAWLPIVMIQQTYPVVFKGSVHRTAKNRWTELNWTMDRSLFRLQLPQFGVGPVAGCLISKIF
ncbi:uncharacterized protein LACBIDRAFT_302420 [Laccaria bicolor S238N-H82]|uniref:Predicted protein n=1 Tax=Laccaria bicolor (strain S238N-H82 / ATCC MYA-4686) TaxID=486041 RepID=B0DHL9_LACBS|nr:uncharacterized protein LACBIDRAFT_302420 [Laccaria bicolor S238N-H82]EDR05751.1 predicted protein [Laccaria bicolor S238N-H82]|eukprot:XP_001883427.1 predicted protein [Laccaria bicolor S238N-H82]